jgi:hypothetical protein
MSPGPDPFLTLLIQTGLITVELGGPGKLFHLYVRIAGRASGNIIAVRNRSGSLVAPAQHGIGQEGHQISAVGGIVDGPVLGYQAFVKVRPKL